MAQLKIGTYVKVKKGACGQGTVIKVTEIFKDEEHKSYQIYGTLANGVKYGPVRLSDLVISRIQYG